MASPPTESAPAAQNHRTIDRVTEILEAVAYQPGISFAELSRVIDAPKSSLHGFVRGLLAKGWLHQDERRFFLGPVIYSLTLVGGNLSAGQVSQRDLDALHDDTGFTVFLGVESSDHLIYVGEAGADSLTGFAARSNIRRDLVATAGGKALLVERPDGERDAYLRKMSAREPELVSELLSEMSDIKTTRIASNLRYQGKQLALGTVVRDRSGRAVAAAIVLGPAEAMRKREAKLRKTLLKHVDGWQSGQPAARSAS